MSAVKDPLVRVCRDDLADKKIIALLVMRLRDTLANEPCDAARDQRHIELLFIKNFHVFHLVGVIKARVVLGAQLANQLRLRGRRDMHGEIPALFDERPRVRAVVRHDGNFVVVKRLRPRYRHRIDVAIVFGRYKSGRARVWDMIFVDQL